MANKLFSKPKGIRECKYTSISRHNAEFSSEYILFDPPSVTSFECAKGEKDGEIVYIREKLVCMWGNEDIEEYVLLDNDCKDIFESYRSESAAAAHGQTFTKAKVEDVTIEYSHKKGVFSRHHYNVWFERRGIYYYLYVKTSDGRKFKSLMEEFIAKAVI